MKTVIEMAREAGFEAKRGFGLLDSVPEDVFAASMNITREIETFAALVRADERARMAEQPAQQQEPVGRTDQQIVDQTEELALWLLSWCFNHQPETSTPMRESTHPFTQRCWAAACHIQEMLTATDPENAVAELEGESGEEKSPQPAVQQEPVGTAFVVTIEDAALKMLDDMISPSLDKECNPIRLIAGKGHSGYGLYICSEDYPEEGAELLAEIPSLYTTPPAQSRPLTTQEIREWWASENGLEDCAMRRLNDFEQVVRAVEAKLKEKNS